MVRNSSFAAPPTFIEKPRDQKVGLNGVVEFHCSASGSPPPSVFWTKEGSQLLMFPDTSYGHMHVNGHGTLRIQGVQREDAGFPRLFGSERGGVEQRARLPPGINCSIRGTAGVKLVFAGHVGCGSAAPDYTNRTRQSNPAAPQHGHAPLQSVESRGRTTEDSLAQGREGFAAG
jgi:hypothetical protein